MLVLPLCQHFCPDKVPFQLAECLGDGADGQCFSLQNDPKKVIKLGIVYEYHSGELFKIYNQMDRVLNYLIRTQPAAYAHVYEQEYLGLYSREMPYWHSGKQKFILYYYTMEKLRKISEDESKVFHSILSHEDRGIAKNFSLDKIREMLEGLGRGLDFDAEKVMLFCENINEASVYHLDLHPRNIMIDDSSNYKCIDMDRCELENEHVK